MKNNVKFTLVVVSALLFSWFCIAMGWDDAAAQGASTSQQQIEQTIGSLVVRNAQCSSQVLALSEQVRKLEKKLAAKATVTAPISPPEKAK